METKVRIRKIIVYVVYCLLVASIQVSFPQYMSFHKQVADIMFVFVALVGYFYGFLDGAIIAVVVGLLRDYFASPSFVGIDGKSTQTIGIGILVLFLVAALSSSFFTRKVKRNYTVAFVSVLVCTILYKVIGHMVIAFWTIAVNGNNYSLSISRMIVDSILPQVLINLIATIPLVVLLRFVGPYKKGVNPALDKNDEGGNPWLTI